ncbi:MAG: four helix bundle protein [Gemmatimonadales bacterium]|nr:four helix bundle protein [Gemmatimonadales bacterium]NIN12440.1 four helix bundle protein [Gemmatimonadales bacterium]NIN50816.1 four helix bundle protein [Gemmatimonadales bacterium]NIP08280.1 four helix bundle protein [Gemmatimonadales bacterium]NIR00804.1 four helix bundle protein [Gemmatimonadales bacterium]
MMPFERLDAWKACHQLVLATYRATDALPVEDGDNLKVYLRRAAILAPAKIARGSASRNRGVFRKWVDVALGYLAEMAYLLHLAVDLEFLPAQSWRELDQLRGRAAFYAWKLYLSLAPSQRSKD